MPKRSLHVLSRSEQLLLLSSLYQQGKIRDWAMIKLCMQTGLRNAELCSLNNLHLVKFGGVVTLLDIDPEIAFARPRQLPLSDSVRGSIKTYLQWKADHGHPLEPAAPLFCTLYTRKRLGTLDFYRIVLSASTVLPKQITPHDLRHTFATELYCVTQDLKVVQHALGLRSTKDLEIYQQYASVDRKQQQLQRAIEAIDSI